MKRTNKHYFQDMLEYSKTAVNFIENIGYEEFVLDKKTAFAVIRSLEVIGESSNKVADELKAKYSGLPWKQMRGLRNRIVHNYDDIDYTIVWNVLKNELPNLIDQIEEIIEEID